MRAAALFTALVSLVVAPPAMAQLAPAGDSVTLEELVVTAPAGPPWWAVSDGDTTVYILASTSWLPGDMPLVSSRIERRLAKANSLIMTPRFADRAFNPKSVAKALQGPAIPPVVKAMMAAGEVESGLLPKGGQSLDGLVWTLAKRNRVPVIRPAKLYSRADAEGLLADLKRPGANCIAASERYIANPTPDDMAERLASVEAWANGDVRPLLARARAAHADRHAYMRHVVGSKPTGLRIKAPECTAEMPTLLRMTQQWVPDETAAIEAALRKPGHSVAVFDPISLVMQDGVLDRLRRKGYTVTAPDKAAELSPAP